MWRNILLRTRTLQGLSFLRSKEGSGSRLFLTRGKRPLGLCWESGKGMLEIGSLQDSRNHDLPESKLRVQQSFPVLDGRLPPAERSTLDANLKNSEACTKRYSELLLASKQRKEKDILRHQIRNQKLLVYERLRLLLDGDDFLELSPLAGHGLPYGNIQKAGIITGIGKIHGIWCMLVANDATVKSGTLYPITIKKLLRAQDIAAKNHLPTVYLVDSGGAFLPLQAESYADEKQGGRIMYNIAFMSSMKISQVAVVCGSCSGGAAYLSCLPEECIIVNKIGSMFLAGPALVKAAINEDATVEDLGGAILHARISGGIDYFVSTEEEAYNQVKNSILTLSETYVLEDPVECDDPLYNAEELNELAPQDFESYLNIKLILSRLTDGSRFHEFKAEYGTTLITGFAHLGGHLIGIVANNGELTYQAALKGSHFVNMCSHRTIPILFLMNTTPRHQDAVSLPQEEDSARKLRAQACMMTTVACAGVPKITLVIGGCFGSESYAMCGRSFDPDFLFLWPNARVALIDWRSPFVEHPEDEDI